MTKAAELAKMGEVLTNSQIGGRRNIVINGAMQVAQRATSVTGLGDGDEGYVAHDRWRHTVGAGAGRYTATQTADGPSGFGNCLKIACTTADTSIAASERFMLEQRIEGQDLQQLKKGTSDAEKITVSFYVKGHDSATYTVGLYDTDGRQVGATFSVTTSWARQTVTFPADTSGVLANDNSAQIHLRIFLHGGSNYTSGTLATAWESATNANQISSSANSIFESTSATFFITGVQLEVGSQATPFEHRSFGEELTLCQRYFCQMHNDEAGNRYIGILQPYSTSAVYGKILDYPATMRTLPSVTQSGNFNVLAKNSGGAIADGSIANLNGNIVGWRTGGWTGGSNFIQGGGAVIQSASGAKLMADAEL